MADKRSSGILTAAVALLLLNVALFVTGVRWAGSVMSDVSEGSENESILAAAAKVDQAERAVDGAISTGIWIGGFVLAVLLVAALHRLARVSTRQRERDDIGSYLRNAARAREDDSPRRRRAREAGL
jgi:uncharacterized membrane protein YciS (DUF1049 family)